MSSTRPVHTRKRYSQWRILPWVDVERQSRRKRVKACDRYDLRRRHHPAAIIETLLKKYHENEDYAVVVPKELLQQAERTRAMFNVLLVVIAGISLLVGGIGIMNIMLATVTERTREIGIRRALGAKRRHIIQQFLTETVVLTASGGLLGVLFGLLCGPLFRGLRSGVTMIAPHLLPPIVHTLEPRIAPWSVGLSLLISLGVGIVFGVYPARQAACMDPIQALRHEWYIRSSVVNRFLRLREFCDWFDNCSNLNLLLDGSNSTSTIQGLPLCRFFGLAVISQTGFGCGATCLDGTSLLLIRTAATWDHVDKWH